MILLGGDQKLLSSEGATTQKFHFNNAKLTKKDFYAKKLTGKYKISKSMGPKASAAHELDQIQKPFPWHIRCSHEQQMLQGLNAISL